MEAGYLFGKSALLAFSSLLPVINPLGTSLILYGLMGGADPQTRKSIAKKIALNSIMLLTITLFVGSYILSFFGITIPIVQAAGGLVLSGMGWQLMNEKDEGNRAVVSTPPSSNYSEEAFFPFTFPITVGPGCFAVAVTLSAHMRQGHSLMGGLVGQVAACLGIIANGMAVYLVFIYADTLVKKLGPAGTKALVRMLAFILLCIGAEISWTGIHSLISTV